MTKKFKLNPEAHPGSRLSRVRYNAKSKTFDINSGDGDPYWIAEDRVRTQADLIAWIHHLCGKTWCDAYLIEDLIETANTRFPGLLDHNAGN